MRVMVVDDELSLCEALKLILEGAGYETVCAASGPEALECLDRYPIDLAILDVMLPGMDGFELCGVLRERDELLPILMLSAKSDIVDKKYGFRAGADDYLGKPFDDEEVLLRVEALLRRRARNDASASGRAVMQEDGGVSCPLEGLEVDRVRCEVSVNGDVIPLTRREYEIVALLAHRPGKVFTKEDIIDELWGREYRESSLSIPTYIRRIRAKIEPDPSKPQIIQTVFGFGYRLGG